MNYLILNLVILNLMSLVKSHIEMVAPAPRRSRYLVGTPGNTIDYDMKSPLGSNRPYPCIGYKKGVIASSYKAGQEIRVELGGEIEHNGGHCQFSVSYDGESFVALKTVLGNCITGSRTYQVKLPSDSPGGDAVFAWTWINRTGNREFYMNCADIKIEGPDYGSIKGRELLIGNMEVPGHVNVEFPEWFSDDYQAEQFNLTSLLSISPKKSVLAKPGEFREQHRDPAPEENLNFSLE